MVSELEFKRYVATQYSGMFNMITEANSAMDLAELSSKTYWDIINGYSDLINKYPKAYEEGKKIGKEMSSKIYG